MSPKQTVDAGMTLGLIDDTLLDHLDFGRATRLLNQLFELCAEESARYRSGQTLLPTSSLRRMRMSPTGPVSFSWNPRDLNSRLSWQVGCYGSTPSLDPHALRPIRHSRSYKVTLPTGQLGTDLHEHPLVFAIDGGSRPERPSRCASEAKCCIPWLMMRQRLQEESDGKNSPVAYSIRPP